MAQSAMTPEPLSVDFYCAACRLVVEIDGDSHADQVEHDAARADRLWSP